MMKRNAFSLMLAATAIIFTGACASTEKESRSINGGTVSDAKNTGSINTNSSAPVSKPQAAGRHAPGKQLSQSPVDRKKQDESTSVPAGRETAGTSDQREARITPLDQSEAASDIDTTRRIRQAIMRDESLSFRAKNVTIVTNGDRVVLTGRVNTRAEADRIKDIARSVTPHHIEDRLEIHQ
jgi:osmotically-inducible protein OsmY